VNQEREQSGFPITAQSGFTLIEVLVALLVLAIGLVGIASLHIAGLRNAHSSYYASIASSVALDFEERLWLAMTDIDQGCIDVTTVVGTADEDGIIDDLEAAWGGGAAGTITIPGLQVNLVNFGTARLDVASESDYWAEVRINVSWTDGRFFQSQETFPYTTRVLCAPEDG
jgi:prepilin-type N-terminal cleavage/methylation domain-containing protein